MKSILIVILFLMNALGFTQNNLNYLDSIKLSLYLSPDYKKVESMILLSGSYSTISYDSASMYGNKALNLAEQINYHKGRVAALCILGVANTRGGNLSKALEFEFKGLQIAKEHKLSDSEAMCYYSIGKSYYFLKDFINSIHYCSLARQLHLQNQGKYEGLIKVYYAENDPFLDNDLVLGEAFMDNNQLDSALLYFRRLYNEAVDSSWKGIISIFLGDALFRNGEKESGINFLKYAFLQKQHEGDGYSIAWACSILARCYKELNQSDSAIYFAKVALQAAQHVGFKDRMLKSTRLLAEVYENIDTIEAYSYLKLATTLNDGLFGQEKVFELQKTLSNAQLQQQEAENREIAFKNKIKLYGLLSALGIILCIALILYRNNIKEKKGKTIIENTLNKLQSTQAQLIQSEKMASLGELTAGIAHEIQNPLNFVNNFSELNAELINELEVASRNETRDTSNEADIIATIKDNSEKINQHGKRASNIVKGMLEHSRASSGIKQHTDMNALCEEYVKLSYQAVRAKDPNFQCDIKFDFEHNLPKVNVVSQDISRVILNLVNNAFQAVNEKQQMLNKLGDVVKNQSTTNQELGAPNSTLGELGVRSDDSAEYQTPSEGNNEMYKPIVSISTKYLNDHIEIIITDNGSGIPDHIKDKIFQPFFTTKPTGQGTGLGLSLAYDIIKAHGGEIKVNSTQGIGSEFLIHLHV
jgi:signal transduction histidine kinase